MLMLTREELFCHSLPHVSNDQNTNQTVTGLTNSSGWNKQLKCEAACQKPPTMMTQLLCAACRGAAFHFCVDRGEAYSTHLPIPLCK